jgi:hypothetical protein
MLLILYFMFVKSGNPGIEYLPGEMVSSDPLCYSILM